MPPCQISDGQRYPDCFFNAQQLFRSFNQTSNIHVLDDAIHSYRDSIHLSKSDFSEAYRLRELATALRSRCNFCGRREDIDEAVECLQKALAIAAPDIKPSILNNLGNTLGDRFSIFHSEIADFNAAVAAFTESIELRLPTDEQRAYPLTNLASTLITHFRLTGNLQTLDRAIGYLQEALQLRPPGHSERKGTLNVLGNSLRTRSEHTDYAMRDLDKSIRYHREAASLHPENGPQRYSPRHNLAKGLRIRFVQSRDMADLEESIRIDQDLLDTYPKTHPERHKFITGLATSLRMSFEWSGDQKALDDAILLGKEAVLLTQNGITASNNLANSYRARYDLHGRAEDLKLAREDIECALRSCPLTHTDHSLLLHTLGCILVAQAEHVSEPEEVLFEAIDIHKAALKERPEGHQFRQASLCDLGNVLCSTYERTGKLEYLEDAITLYHDALRISNASHSQYHTTLISVSNARLCRFEALRQDDDIQQALDLCREAVNNSPSTTKANQLGSLCMVALRCYEARQNPTDLTTAVTAGEEALELCSRGNPYRSQIISNLAHAYIARSDESGAKRDRIAVLDRAIALLTQCVELGNTQNIRHSETACLGHALAERYSASHQRDDLHKGIALLEKALNELPPHYPNLSSILCNLAIAIFLRSQLSGNKDDEVLCFSRFRAACSTPSSSSRVRLAAALSWIHFARQTSHESAIEASRIALELMARTLFISPTIEQQRQALGQAPKALALDAAAYAISHGEVETGVEMLEQGRSLLWSRMRGYRRPIEELRAHNKALADEFEQVSKQLDRLATSSDVHDAFLVSSQAKAEAQWKRQRQLSEKWEELLKKIRDIAGFKDLLRPIPYCRLRAAACGGPVIAIILSTHRLDAVIVREHGSPIAIHLNSDVCSWNDMAIALRSKVTSRSSRTSSDSRWRAKPGYSTDRCLQQLWDTIVHPVAMALTNAGVPKMARIWWCPTSVLCSLPLHAARGTENGIRCLYISSYTPSLGSLIAARTHVAAPASPKLLAVACPGDNLRHVAEEVCAVHDTLDGMVPVRQLVGNEATADTVRSALPGYTWLHIACHGKLNPADPFQSSFRLHEGTLSIVDIMRAQVPSADLAFLSACDSAAGDDDHPDEAIHLAAALQFCGFRSVVGTLWPMLDVDGPVIARQFYAYVRKDHDFATALSKALDDFCATVANGQQERWLPFVHVGI
ncbi:CHAT domain-containing protein [Mycena galericulata]|nr:CHAT domain-containing protein [Mycena galericulata]